MSLSSSYTPASENRLSSSDLNAGVISSSGSSSSWGDGGRGLGFSWKKGLLFEGAEKGKILEEGQLRLT